MCYQRKILLQIQGAKPVSHWMLWTILIGRTWCWPWMHKNIQCCMSVLTSGMMLTYINIWLPFGTVFKLSQGNIQSLLISLLCLFKIEPSRWKSEKGRRNEINNTIYLNLDWRDMLNIHHGAFIYDNSTFFYSQLLWSFVMQNVKLHKIFIKILPR